MNQTRNERKQRAQELVWIALVTAFLFGVFALGMSVGMLLCNYAISPWLVKGISTSSM